MSVRQHCKIVFWGLAMACSAADEGGKGAVGTAAVPPTAPPAAPSSKATAPAGKVSTVVRGLPRPLKTRVGGLALVDRVDVGNEADERAHQYAVQEPTFRGTREFEMPAENLAYAEDGRAMKLSESFRIKVVPNQENLLVKAFDTLSKDQKVRVIVGGKSAGEWALPDGGSNRYGEAKFPLADSLIGDRTQVDIKLEYISGTPDTNTFMYWVYAEPHRKLEAPVRTDISGLKLTDRLDVGADGDEAAHQYVIDKSSYAGTQQFEWPANGLPFLENGRGNKSFETFRMKVAPSKDHLLIKAFDTYSKNQIVRVLVDGNVVGDWALPDGVPRYGEGAFRIPAKFIGARSEINLRVEFVSASLDSNSFQYWLFANG
jgi:hypothetical protein